MSEWEKITLGESGTWLSGGTPSTSRPEYWGGDIPWISAASLKDYRISRSDRMVTQEGALNGTRIVASETILMVVRGMSLKSEFRIGIAQRQVAFGQDCKALIARPGIRPSFLGYAIKAKTPEILSLVDEAGHGTGRLQTDRLESVEIDVPASLDVQASIARTLELLDDRIAVNERIAATVRQLGLALFAQSLLEDDPVDVDVDSVSSLLTRGIAPKYSEDPNDLVVLNQKCIRDGRVSLAPARLTVRETVKTPKLLQRDDILVNSTGVGTLGRVARWTSDSRATVDSHVTIVRFDEKAVDPVSAGFAMLRAQPEIEAMGEGSTGQTELPRTQLGGLEITLPSGTRQRRLRPALDALEGRGDQALVEAQALAALRDTLLPQLMSGRLRVRDAEKIVEDHV
ncbi:restriction endonuclease subunit S [Kitasatospora sp. NPDC087314]|uniref:restriction endonuclease subunit S n=1 Tax=Kitasatospora sp. NPDC087314 TaxID=3364068 RepID=UPI0038206234